MKTKERNNVALWVLTEKIIGRSVIFVEAFLSHWKQCVVQSKFNTEEIMTMFIFLRIFVHVIWLEILLLQTSTVYDVKYKSIE